MLERKQADVLGPITCIDSCYASGTLSELCKRSDWLLVFCPPHAGRCVRCTRSGICRSHLEIVSIYKLFLNVNPDSFQGRHRPVVLHEARRKRATDLSCGLQSWHSTKRMNSHLTYFWEPPPLSISNSVHRVQFTDWRIYPLTTSFSSRIACSTSKTFRPCDPMGSVLPSRTALRPFTAGSSLRADNASS